MQSYRLLRPTCTLSLDLTSLSIFRIVCDDDMTVAGVLRVLNIFCFVAFSSADRKQPFNPSS
jgi:hypothetical protein